MSKRTIVLRSLLDHFWLRWKDEYLKSLRERDLALIGKKFELTVGNIVLISDDTPRSTWRLGKILELFESRDGNVRSVKLQTSSGIVTRPVIKLVNLEIMSQDCNNEPIERYKEYVKSRPPKREAALRAQSKISDML